MIITRQKIINLSQKYGETVEDIERQILDTEFKQLGRNYHFMLTINMLNKFLGICSWLLQKLQIRAVTF